MKRLVFALAFSLCVFGADPVHRASTSDYETWLNGVVAQFVDGGSWQTTITLANVDTVQGRYTVNFYGDDGKPLAFDTTDGTGDTLTGTIPARGSHVIATLGTKSTQSTGWALVTITNMTGGNLISGGNAFFRQRVAGRPDQEASMPIVGYLDGSNFAIPFDNYTSSNGLALVNPLSYKSITVFLSFYDEQGNRFLLDNLTLGPLTHTSFDLGTRYPTSFGVRGTLQIETADWVNVLGLRFFGSAFTSLLPLNMELVQ